MFVRVFLAPFLFRFFRCFSDEEIASFPRGSVFGFSWTKMSCQSCSFNYYSCIVQFFENDEKSMEFLLLMASYPQLSPVSIVNPYILMEETRKHGIVEKGLVCQSPRKQSAAFPFRTLKGLFCIIPIFRLGKLYNLLTTTSAISGTTGLCWNAITFLQEHRLTGSHFAQRWQIRGLITRALLRRKSTKQ